jgi:hypothetical protein
MRTEGSRSRSTMREYRLMMTEGEWAIVCLMMRKRVTGHDTSGVRSAKWSRHGQSTCAQHGPSYWP